MDIHGVQNFKASLSETAICLAIYF